MLDPTGRVVTLVRDNVGVAAITSRVRGGEKAASDTPPFVVIRRVFSVPWIGDPDTETAGVNTVDYVALCYQQKVGNGEQLAFALAGAVFDAVNDHSLETFPVAGGRGVIWRIQVDSIGSRLTDPVTGEPYVPVQFSVLAATQVAAA